MNIVPEISISTPFAIMIFAVGMGIAFYIAVRICQINNSEDKDIIKKIKR